MKSIYVFSARPMQFKHVSFKKNAIPIIYTHQLNHEDIPVQTYNISLPSMFTYPDVIEQHEHNMSHDIYHLYRYDIDEKEYEWFVKNILTMYTKKIPTQWLAYWLRSFIKPNDFKLQCSFDGDDVGKGSNFFPPGYITVGASFYQMYVGIPPDEHMNWENIITA